MSSGLKQRMLRSFSREYQPRFNSVLGKALAPLFVVIGIAHLFHLLLHTSSVSNPGIFIVDSVLGITFIALALVVFKFPLKAQLNEAAFCGALCLVAGSIALHTLLGEAISQLTMLFLIVGAGISLVSPLSYVFLVTIFWVFGLAPSGADANDSERLFLYAAATLASCVAYISRRLRHIDLESLRDDLEERIKQSKEELARRMVLEDDLRERESQYRLIADNATDVIYVYDQQGVITYVSPSIEKVLGFRPDERIGKRFTETTMAPNSMSNATELFKQAAEGDLDEVSLEMQHATKAGGFVWTEIKGKVVRDADGKVVANHVVMRDISDRREQEAALRESEQRLREITERVDDVIWSADANFVFTYASPNIERITGWPPRALVGNELRTMIIEKDGSSAADFDAAVTEIKSGRTQGFSLEVLHDCRERGFRWFDVHGRAVRSEDGELLAVHGVTREVHERHIFQNALLESEQRYRNLTERALDPIESFDANGYMTYANPASETMWGIPPEKLVGGHYHFALAKESREAADAAVARLRTGVTDTEQLELKHQLQDGSWVWSELRAWPIRDAQGRFDGFQFVSRDVSDRKRTAELLMRQRTRLAERAKQLAALNEQLDRFAALVSHDLKGPLRRMAKRLAKEDLEHNDLEEIRQQLDSLQGHIDHILEVASSNQPLVRENFDLGEMVRSVVYEVGLDSGRDCELNAPTVGEVTTHADKKLIRALLRNLIGNAYKYTPADQSLSLTIERRISDGEVYYTVADNGDGFPDENLSLLFEPFARGDNEGTRKGYGIGLSTVEQTVKQHGGTIELTNRPEGGAHVTFSLGEKEVQDDRASDHAKSPHRGG